MNITEQHEFINNIIRPAWIEIDLDAVAQNVRNIKQYLGGVQYLAVVKADGYGLGAVETAQVILENGADRLGVVMLDEAIQLRRAGITAPILNMGNIRADQAYYVPEYGLEQIVFRPDVAKALSHAAGAKSSIAQIHVKIDTGMSRYGVRYDKAAAFIESIINLPNLEIIGAMTHFPKSDAIDKSFALLQIERMLAIKKALVNKGITIPLWHTANSGATLDLPAAHFDMVRVGLMNYGYFPSSDVRRPFTLHPAMSVKARIININRIRRGDSVGYGRRFIAEKDETIAVLPMGYSDGYSRKLSQVGQVLIKGRRIPIVGGLCMDAFFIKITDHPDIQEGDIATLMGIDGDEEISPHDIARLAGSVSYEVISCFGKRLPRVHIRNGKIVKIKNYLLS
ncbi:MAG TPA: alanine racemase [bacterium]|nr:alanine racemase [bacterium]HPN46193.1 alanine racemase [bacterium]